MMDTTKKTAPAYCMGAGADGVGMPASSPDDIVARQKNFATLQAKFALLGHELHQLPDGSYFICNGCYSRHFDGLSYAEVFLRRLGGAA
jgi:hypothetical protein